MVAAGPSFTNYAIDALTCITALHLIDVCTTINRFSMKLEGLHFPPPLLGRDAQFITYESSSWRLFIANNCTELESLSKLSNMRSRLVCQVSLTILKPEPRFHVTVGQAWMAGRLCLVREGFLTYFCAYRTWQWPTSEREGLSRGDYLQISRLRDWLDLRGSRRSYIFNNNNNFI